MSGSLTDWHDASPKIFTAEELASAADLLRDLDFVQKLDKL